MKVRSSKHAKLVLPQQPVSLSWSPRTFSIVGHRSSGKTSLAELLLQAVRVTRTIGSVEAGTSLLDWSDEAHRHRQTLSLSVAWFEHQEQPLQLIDTPGAAFLAHEQQRALLASDTALVVIDAAEGVRVGTEAALRQARCPRTGQRMPLIAVASKIDRLSGRGLAPAGAWERSRSSIEAGPIEALATQLQGELGRSGASCPRVVPVQLPLFGEDGALQGLVDVLEDRVLRYATDGSGALSPEPVPTHLRDQVAVAAERVAEAVAMTDDVLLEHYLEELELPPEEVQRGLVAAVASGAVVPLLLTSAEAHVGAVPLLDALARWLPEPRGVWVRDPDGAQQLLQPGPGFVAQVVACQRDRAGQPFTLLRVWSGTSPRGPWREGLSGRELRIRKLYRIRGPRRASAPVAGPGALIATWEPLGLRPGETVTDGPRLAVVVPGVDHAGMTWRLELPGAAAQEALEAVVWADGALSHRPEGQPDAWLLTGRSEAHLRLAVERIEALGVGAVRTGLPRVAYREIPAARVAGVEGVHLLKGDHGLVSEYGRCEVSLGPTGPDEDVLRFVDAFDDTEALPLRFRSAIAEGVASALGQGPTAGYPVVGVEAELTGGDYDILQSTEDHLRLAGERATRAALQRAGTCLLEPWSEVVVCVPQAVLGDLISDIAANRGRIVGMEVEGAEAKLVASCPHRELRTFASRLEGITGGRGRFSLRDRHYERLPSELVAEVRQAVVPRG